MAIEVIFGEKVKKLGFEIGLEDEKTCISGVKPGSEAHQRDLRAGDVLISINDVPVVKPGRDEIKALLKQRPLTLRVDRPETGPAASEDSGSESDTGKAPQERHDADLALLQKAKARARKAEASGYAKAQAPPAEDPAADSGEDSAEETQKKEVTPERFDRDMDLLHKHLKSGPSAAPEPRDDEVLAMRLQEELLQGTQDDAAIAAQLQREEEIGFKPSAEPGPRPDLLAAAMEVAAAREEERLAAEVEAGTWGRERDAEEDEDGWAEEEVQRCEVSGKMQIKVRVPEGCTEGDTLEVVAPSGELIHVVIPRGNGPGSLLMVQVQNRDGGPQNMLYAPLTEKHPLEEWEAMLQKLVSGYSVIKVARNGKLYNRNFWLANGSLRTNGRFSSGIDLRQLTGIFRGAVSQEFIKLRKSAAPRKSTSLGSSLLRTFVASKPSPPVEHPDPEEAGVVIIATGGRSFSLLFPGGGDERDEFAETATFAVQRVRREMGRPCKF